MDMFKRQKVFCLFGEFHVDNIHLILIDFLTDSNNKLQVYTIKYQISGLVRLFYELV